MRNLVDFIKERLGVYEHCMPVIEMATISQDEKWGKEHYKVALHGPAVGDREYPHVHIYWCDDIYPYKKFNFEISLIDILCKDEINLVTQVDKLNSNISRKNKTKCSWEGYWKIRDGFEDWLIEKCKLPGEFKDNLDALCWAYNNESPHSMKLKDYIENHGLKVLAKYQKYI